MDRTTLLLLQAVCAVALLSGSEALRCYSCISDQDPRCADPIDKSTLPLDCNLEQVKRAGRLLANALGASSSLGVDAFGERYAQYGGSQSAMACQKLDIFVPNAQNRNARQNITVRGCALLNEEPEEHCRRVSQGMQSEQVQNMFCGACKAEGCNAASSLSVAVVSVLAPVLLALGLGARH